MAIDLSTNARDESPSERRGVDLKLHDETIQALYGVSLRLQAAVELIEESPEALTTELEQAMRTLDGVIVDLRDRIGELTGNEQHEEGASPPGFLLG